MVTLQDQMNQVFDDTFTRSGKLDADQSSCAWRPAVDVFEIPDGVMLKAELPGISKENILIELKDTVLTITGERPVEARLKEKHYICQERCFGSFRRSFTMRDAVDPEKIKAKFKDGILEIEIKRPEEALPKQIKIDIT
jgi:HSP20 family protein